MSNKIPVHIDRLLELIIYSLERDNAEPALALAKEWLQAYKENEEREKASRETLILMGMQDPLPPNSFLCLVSGPLVDRLVWDRNLKVEYHMDEAVLEVADRIRKTREEKGVPDAP